MTKIVIVDDHARVRSLLSGLLSEQPGFEVIGEARDGYEGLSLVQQHKPDVVITDLKMDGMDGLDFTRKVCAVSESIGVIVLSMYGEPLYLTQAREAGARGYVIKGGDFEELVEAIHEVSSGRRYASPSFSTIN